MKEILRKINNERPVETHVLNKLSDPTVIDSAWGNFTDIERGVAVLIMYQFSIKEVCAQLEISKQRYSQIKLSIKEKLEQAYLVMEGK